MGKYCLQSAARLYTYEQVAFRINLNILSRNWYSYGIRRTDTSQYNGDWKLLFGAMATDATTPLPLSINNNVYINIDRMPMLFQIVKVFHGNSFEIHSK